MVSWKPLVDDILAVGCHDCCILWTVDPASLSARPGSGCAQVISSPSNQPVHSLSWDPKSSLLVLASKNSSKIEIWDSDREELILRKSGLTCVAKVVFNQSGDRLLVSGQNSLSVFQCTDWKVETWSGLEGTVEHINWSDDGDKFIFAVTNKVEHILRLIMFIHLHFHSCFVLASIACWAETARQNSSPPSNMKFLNLPGTMNALLSPFVLRKHKSCFSTRKLVPLDVCVLSSLAGFRGMNSPSCSPFVVTLLARLISVPFYQ